jgi:hypothetical protein
VNRTRYPDIVAITHETQQFGYRVVFDLRILVQEEHEVGSLPQRVRDSYVTSSAETDVP